MEGLLYWYGWIIFLGELFISDCEEIVIGSLQRCIDNIIICENILIGLV